MRTTTTGHHQQGGSKGQAANLNSSGLRDRFGSSDLAVEDHHHHHHHQYHHRPPASSPSALLARKRAGEDLDGFIQVPSPFSETQELLGFAPSDGDDNASFPAEQTTHNNLLLFENHEQQQQQQQHSRGAPKWSSRGGADDSSQQSIVPAASPANDDGELFPSAPSDEPYSFGVSPLDNEPFDEWGRRHRLSESKLLLFQADDSPRQPPAAAAAASGNYHLRGSPLSSATTTTDPLRRFSLNQPSGAVPVAGSSISARPNQPQATQFSRGPPPRLLATTTGGDDKSPAGVARMLSGPLPVRSSARGGGLLLASGQPSRLTTSAYQSRRESASSSGQSASLARTNLNSSSLMRSVSLKESDLQASAMKRMTLLTVGGLFAGVAAIFNKLAFTFSDSFTKRYRSLPLPLLSPVFREWVIRGSCIVTMLTCNTMMLKYNFRCLRTNSALATSVCQFATSTMTSGVLAIFVFGEILTRQWLFGASLIIGGVLLLGQKSQAAESESADETASPRQANKVSRWVSEKRRILLPYLGIENEFSEFDQSSNSGRPPSSSSSWATRGGTHQGSEESIATIVPNS